MKSKNSTDQVKRKAGRPKRTDKDHASAPSTEKGTNPGEKRRTYIVNNEVGDKIDEIAHQRRDSIKTVVNESFKDTIEKWEKNHGPLKLPPKS